MTLNSCTYLSGNGWR